MAMYPTRRPNTEGRSGQNLKQKVVVPAIEAYQERVKEANESIAARGIQGRASIAARVEENKNAPEQQNVLPEQNVSPAQGLSGTEQIEIRPSASPMNDSASLIQAVEASRSQEVPIPETNIIPNIKTPNIQAAAEAGAADARFDSPGVIGTSPGAGSMANVLSGLDLPGVAEASSPESGLVMAGAYLEGTALDPRTAASPQERGLVEIEGSAGGAFARPEDIEAAKQRRLARFGTEEERLKEFGTLNYTADEMQQIRSETAGTLSRFGRGLADGSRNQRPVSINKTLQGLTRASKLTELETLTSSDNRSKKAVSLDLLGRLQEADIINENGSLIDASLTDKDVRTLNRAIRKGLELQGSIGKEAEKQAYQRDLDIFMTNLVEQRGSPERQRKLADQQFNDSINRLLAGNPTDADYARVAGYKKVEQQLKDIDNPDKTIQRETALFAARMTRITNARKLVSDDLKAHSDGELELSDTELAAKNKLISDYDSDINSLVAETNERLSNLDVSAELIQQIGDAIVPVFGPAAETMDQPDQGGLPDDQAQALQPAETGLADQGAGQAEVVKAPVALSKNEQGKVVDLLGEFTVTEDTFKPKGTGKMGQRTQATEADVQNDLIDNLYETFSGFGINEEEIPILIQNAIEQQVSGLQPDTVVTEGRRETNATKTARMTQDVLSKITPDMIQSRLPSEVNKTQQIDRVSSLITKGNTIEPLVFTEEEREQYDSLLRKDKGKTFTTNESREFLKEKQTQLVNTLISEGLLEESELNNINQKDLIKKIKDYRGIKPTPRRTKSKGLPQ